MLDETTLITGDLVRGQVAGRLNLLPDAKLADRAQAQVSVRRIVEAYPRIDTVLVGDGGSVFHTGSAAPAAVVDA